MCIMCIFKINISVVVCARVRAFLYEGVHVICSAHMGQKDPRLVVAKSIVPKAVARPRAGARTRPRAMSAP